ncbi:hypothetical protein, variant 2 [Cryptococcus neoformans var. grubii H99]|uniref:Uncharacterized protein n=1 Tax=Cryptococcus neoformans (strain H99 / ATCC 208821 / CBS 10515 / FGSC 9487) TaxID=235443 RepID=T2BN92_CRYN9|nr:hypothetical protein, variant 2 [Cryptococcus neoformans var. grubii H99]AGV14645.1 hypothetical protein, variant 2 [Cryptococcus neoformans var. grubii H99]AUB27419.1 hypothetical protein CKF44_07845 [Cryptococcus neoformans var. grubii]|eukprot:XP_012052313.1 hypothetical protein, variant 2 [Cryptococcus neoformans var. grubii H99]
MHSLLFRPLLPLHPHSYVLSVDASIVTSRSSSTSFLLSPSDILPAISPPPLPATDDGISGHIRPLSMPAVNCTSIGPGVPAVPAVPGVGGMRMCGSWYCLILRMILGMGSFSMSVVDQMLVAGAAPRVDYSAFLFLCRSVCAPTHSKSTHCTQNLRHGNNLEAKLGHVESSRVWNNSVCYESLRVGQ